MQKSPYNSKQNNCPQRAYLREAFLEAGSISEPTKGYHLEIVTQTQEKAIYLQTMINRFHMAAKVVKRKAVYVVYLKEASHIVDLLNIMQAHTWAMELENVRILKDMRNTVNRKVNCETANINKTVSAALKQVEDIEYIKEKQGLNTLPTTLKELAMVRLEYPESSLKELGELLEPPVGKSGVNHRLRKLSEMAQELRENQE